MDTFRPRDTDPCSAQCTGGCTTCTLHTRSDVATVLATTGHSIPAGLDTDALRQKAVEAAIRQEVGIHG